MQPGMQQAQYPQHQQCFQHFQQQTAGPQGRCVCPSVMGCSSSLPPRQAAPQMTQLAENSEEQTPAGYSENGSESGASDEREDDAAAAHEHGSAHGSARGDSPGDDRMRQLLGENEMLRGHVDRLLHRF